VGRMAAEWLGGIVSEIPNRGHPSPEATLNATPEAHQA
jgi:hypothetical protein